MELRTIIFVTAVMVAVAGSVILILNFRRNTVSLHYLAWFFLAFFPALIFFLFFPESTAEGTIKSITIGGPAVLYIVIWQIGVKGRSKNLIQGVTSPEALKPLDKQLYYASHAPSGKQAGVITGDLIMVKEADVWVNSENTNMVMARYYDQSISGLIRYYGSRRNEAGLVTDDLIANALAEKVGEVQYVAPASVIETTSGMLEQDNNVKAIFHVAAVQGFPGAGYKPVTEIGQCVTNILKKAYRDTHYQRLIFPLFGTGTAGEKPENVVAEMLKRLDAFLKDYPDTSLETIYFLAYTQRDYKLIKKQLAGFSAFGPLKAANKSRSPA